MANTFKVLFRGAADTSSQTLYTVPASTTTLVSSIVVTNTAGATATYDISLNDVVLANDVSVPANDSAVLELKQVIEAGQTIKALASATTVNFHISGLEITG
jgi:hypothetical protein